MKTPRREEGQALVDLEKWAQAQRASQPTGNLLECGGGLEAELGSSNPEGLGDGKHGSWGTRKLCLSRVTEVGGFLN